ATGELPFDGASPFTIALKHMQEPPPPPTEKVQDLPPALEWAILRAMAKSPNDRFQTGEEFAAALETAVAKPAAPVAAGSDMLEFALAESAPPRVVASGYPLGSAGDTGRLSIPASGESAIPGAPPRVFGARRWATLAALLAGVALILVWMPQTRFGGGRKETPAPGMATATPGSQSTPGATPLVTPAETPGPPPTPTDTPIDTPEAAAVPAPAPTEESAPAPPPALLPAPSPAGAVVSLFGKSLSPSMDEAIKGLRKVRNRIGTLDQENPKHLNESQVLELAGMIVKSLDMASPATASDLEKEAYDRELHAMNGVLARAFPDDCVRVLNEVKKQRPGCGPIIEELRKSMQTPAAIPGPGGSRKGGGPASPKNRPKTISPPRG
ncbi:MAG: hypothetical protein NTW86_15955, partial [Candidatus Sumerlaeota bacterium]|nr:hypothetical protein [Candidatus Sumerlaeota bacterium]